MGIRSLVATAGLVVAPVVFPAQPAEPPPPSQAEVQAWVQAAYPAVLNSVTAMPAQFYFGFVVGPDRKVLAHSVILRPSDRPVNQDLQAMFPSQSFVGSPMGGVTRVSASQGTGQLYGVIWVMVPSPQ